MYELHPESAQNNKKLLRKARSNSYIAEVSWGFSSSDLKVETINLSYLYHRLVEMTLYHYGGSHLPVGWAVWWWTFLWRAMAGCHRSSLVSGRHTPRHECLHITSSIGIYLDTHLVTSRVGVEWTILVRVLSEQDFRTRVRHSTIPSRPNSSAMSRTFCTCPMHTREMECGIDQRLDTKMTATQKKTECWRWYPPRVHIPSSSISYSQSPTHCSTAQVSEVKVAGKTGDRYWNSMSELYLPQSLSQRIMKTLQSVNMTWPLSVYFQWAREQFGSLEWKWSFGASSCRTGMSCSSVLKWPS